MRAHGQTYYFDTDVDTMETILAKLRRHMRPDEPVNPDLVAESHPVAAPTVPPPDSRFSEVLSKDELLTKIGEEVATFSSAALPGMVHPDIIPQLYRMQTQKWKDIAEDHVQNISQTITVTTNHLVQSICPKTNDSGMLKAEISEIVSKKNKDALLRTLDTLYEYCASSQSQLLQTSDPNFAAKLRDQKIIRLVDTVIRGNDVFLYGAEAKVTGREVVETLFTECHPSAISNTTKDVHDTLKIYYEVSVIF